jgi:hypothetical protein
MKYNNAHRIDMIYKRISVQGVNDILVFFSGPENIYVTRVDPATPLFRSGSNRQVSGFHCRDGR